MQFATIRDKGWRVAAEGPGCTQVVTHTSTPYPRIAPPPSPNLPPPRSLHDAHFESSSRVSWGLSTQGAKRGERFPRLPHEGLQGCSRKAGHAIPIQGVPLIRSPRGTADRVILPISNGIPLRTEEARLRLAVTRPRACRARGQRAGHAFHAVRTPVHTHTTEHAHFISMACMAFIPTVGLGAISNSPPQKGSHGNPPALR